MQLPGPSRDSVASAAPAKLFWSCWARLGCCHGTAHTQGRLPAAAAAERGLVGGATPIAGVVLEGGRPGRQLAQHGNISRACVARQQHGGRGDQRGQPLQR